VEAQKQLDELHQKLQVVRQAKEDICRLEEFMMEQYHKLHEAIRSGGWVPPVTVGDMDEIVAKAAELSKRFNRG
jgi:hypothetical protein